MNISKHEQRTLHALARVGSLRIKDAKRESVSNQENQITQRVIWRGRINHHKDDRGDIIAVDCITRDGWKLADCSLGVFRRLRRRRFIRSESGAPYRITREGLAAVRSQLDNR